MAFTSLQFIGLFFILACIYFFSNAVLRKVILVIANSLFYLSFGKDLWIYLLMLTVISYFSAQKFDGNKKKLIVTILIPLLGLIVFKYLTFIMSLVEINNSLKLIAPIGISFFTFKIISYLIDVYKGKIDAVTDFVDYFIYVTFFPQITSGPIERADHFIPQLDHLDRKLSYNELKSGLFQFVLGCFEKVVIADRLGVIVNHVFGNVMNFEGIYLWIALFVYSFQIYCDFDAYSNMAIGLGKMLGFNTNPNFDAPYFATNLSNFWRRWHISLSSWFKDYVYIPLGGNRHNYAFNIMVISLLSGVWHGASWNYVLWGFGHGVAQVLAKVFHKEISAKIKYHNIFTKYLSVGVTFLTVSLLWIFFRVTDINEIIYIFNHLLVNNIMLFEVASLGISNLEFVVALILIGIVILTDYFRYNGDVIAKFNNLHFLTRWTFYTVLILAFILFAMYGPGYNPTDFIYIQF